MKYYINGLCLLIKCCMDLRSKILGCYICEGLKPHNLVLSLVCKSVSIAWLSYLVFLEYIFLLLFILDMFQWGM